MSEISGFIVALIVAEKVGVFDKFMGMEKKKIGTTYTYDPGVDTTITMGSRTFKNKGECKAWFHSRSLPTPLVCR